MQVSFFVVLLIVNLHFYNGTKKCFNLLPFKESVMLLLDCLINYHFFIPGATIHLVF